ncbi:MAG: hypothetical protein ACKVUT_17225 [Gaiella sp.]
MDVVAAFVATLVSARLAAELLRRSRDTEGAQRLASRLWAASLGSFAVACGALAWGAAAGFDERAFRVYYLAGALLSAPLLGAGSLVAVRGWRVGGVAAAYAGVAVGVAVAVPLHGTFPGTTIPEAQEHLALVPARLLAITGNSVGTALAVAVLVLSLKRRPVRSMLLLVGIGVAAAGSALTGLGVAEASVSFAVASVLLYAGARYPRERIQSPPRV